MPRYPALLEINTRPWLRRLSDDAGKPITLADIGDDVLDGFARDGFDWIWLLSVWQVGPESRAVSRQIPSPWRAECEAALPDLTDADIAGSGFSIADYKVNEDLGGAAALAGFRARLAKRGIKLMLDFVPNHTGLDFTLDSDPAGFLHPGQRGRAGGRPRQLLAGRDRSGAANPGSWPRSEFPGLDGYAAAQLCQSGAASRPDGEAGGDRQALRRAALRHGDAAAARGLPPDLGPHARALLAQGHRGGPPGPSGFHLHGGGLLGPRMGAAAAGFRLLLRQAALRPAAPRRMRRRSAAISPPASTIRTSSPASWRITTSRGPRPPSPGRSIRPPPSSPSSRRACASSSGPGRRGATSPARPSSAAGRSRPRTRAVAAFYARLLAVLKAERRLSRRCLVADRSAAGLAGNPTADDFIALPGQDDDGVQHLVVVNYADHRGQCYLQPALRGASRSKRWRLIDEMGIEVYERDGTALIDPGLYHRPGPLALQCFHGSEGSRLFVERDRSHANPFPVIPAKAGTRACGNRAESMPSSGFRRNAG